MPPARSDDQPQRPGPTPLLRSARAPQLTDWLGQAAREQLRRDLRDLPGLVDQVDRHREALLRQGTPTLDRIGRIPANLQVVDLTDQRTKDGAAILDPIGEADLARRIGERRHGILPTLSSWVSLAVGEMHDCDCAHTPPVDPAERQPTITTESGWILQHLDWIVGQQWVVELAQDVRGIVADLEQLVGPEGLAPDERTAMCALDLAELLDISSSTVRMWKARGWIDWAMDPSGDVIRDLKGRRAFWVVEARAIMRDTRGCKSLPNRGPVT